MFQNIKLHLQLFKGDNGSNFELLQFFTQIFHFWHTHSPYNNYTCCKVSLMSLTYFLSYDFLFLEIRTYIENLSPHTNFKYMIQDFLHSILDTSRKRLTINISETCPEKKEKNYFVCQNLIYEISGLYCMGFIFYFEKQLKYKKIELKVLIPILCGTCRKKNERDSLIIVEVFAF